MLAPILGTLCLILDLHTPRRFYNMLRLIKATSPMSLGSWGLIGFSATSAGTALLQLCRGSAALSWLRGGSHSRRCPPHSPARSWAPTPLRCYPPPAHLSGQRRRESLAVRFASSAVASAAAALRLGERTDRRRRDLDSIAVAALAVELAATLASEQAECQARSGHASRKRTPEPMVIPLALLLASLVLPGRLGRTVSAVGSLASLGVGLAMRISVLHRGDQSARQPHRSLRFAQFDNLPRA